MRDAEILSLEFPEEELETLGINLIENKKMLNNFLAEARQLAKGETCKYCGKPVKGFCNSHSVPAFCLRNIATNGEVYYSNALVDFPLLDEKKGVNRAGTFQIICRECDSKIFSEYENPDNYNKSVTPQMIAQMAMKNYLKSISKRINEHSIFKLLGEKQLNAKGLVEHMHNVQDLDLREYEKGYEKAKRLSKKNWDNEYYVFFCKKLDYVVPIAIQTQVALAVDLKGQIIQNIYNMSSEYFIQELNICVFPLENTSIVMMFIDATHKRYRKFYKEFNKLSLDEQLSIINYIIFLYSEEMFISKQIPEHILKDKLLKVVSQKSGIAMLTTPQADIEIMMKEEFGLDRHRSIPNLLSREYKLR